MVMKNSSICVLVSGGLDSAALLGALSRRYRTVVPIYSRQGLAWEAVELYWLRRFLRAMKRERTIQPLVILEMPMADVYGRHWSLGHRKVPGARTPDQAVYLPGRNPLLTLKAAVFAAMHGIPTLAVGSLDHNPFPDATPDFFKRWSAVLSRALSAPIRCIAPFRTLTKTDVIQRNRQWPLHLSFSCIQPRGKRHCGRCNKCAERKKAFRAAGVEDRTDYAA